MSISVTPTDATLGAIVEDINLDDMSDSDRAQVLDAFHEHAVLIFPNQFVSTEGQISFSNGFGRIERMDAKKKMEAVFVSNKKADGSIFTGEEYQANILRGNEGWHTDSSYMPLSAKASCLTALELPADGGGTGFADMRAAYDALDDETKERIEGVSALHSLYHSQAKIGHVVKTGSGYGFHTKGAPLRPLIKVHPDTGRKSLYIGRHAYRIPGMKDDEARQLLSELLDFACQPPRIYEHNWQVGDTVIWDNRCVLHRARPYDKTQARVLRHTRIAGEPESELASTMADERADSFEAVA